jgi:hypothetical protein
MGHIPKEWESSVLPLFKNWDKFVKYLLQYFQQNNTSEIRTTEWKVFTWKPKWIHEKSFLYISSYCVELITEDRTEFNLETNLAFIDYEKALT